MFFRKSSDERVVALIPARAGSKRVPGKNIRELNGHPLIAYTIAAAKESGIFNDIIVSTDSDEIADIATGYGAEVPFMRPDKYAGDKSPDIEWIKYTLEKLREEGRTWNFFSILRPTSPFRRGHTIKKAFLSLLKNPEADSIRAVEKCGQHPYKMWTLGENYMEPLFNAEEGETPFHSRGYQTLPEIYAQNASLEIASVMAVFEKGTISGNKIVPFVSEAYEGFDINTAYDWIVAEHLVKEDSSILPEI